MEPQFPDGRSLFVDDPSGLRAALAHVESLWSGAVARAGALPEVALHERVDGEWSFLETLRHLVFATDAWIRRMVLGEPLPFHPWGVAFGSYTGSATLGLDVGADPSFAEVLAVRDDRVRGARAVFARLTPDELGRRCEAPDAIGYPVREDLVDDDTGTVIGSIPVLHCLWTVLEEEWWHHQYATRDLAVLEAGQ